MLWAATGLTWLTAPVGGPTLLVFPFFVLEIARSWSTPSGVDFFVLGGLSLLWLIALVSIGLMHQGKARWTHFAVAGALTAGMFLLTFLTAAPGAAPQLLRIP